ncbi:hypothetical protein J2S89_003385 [Arthrobacter bambusae]|nr:hypothetical protein [Arthrobacter bambusae]MDQ0099753.1 hypothetical protein [Arthrobacter bambusae]
MPTVIAKIPYCCGNNFVFPKYRARLIGVHPLITKFRLCMGGVRS